VAYIDLEIDPYIQDYIGQNVSKLIQWGRDSIFKNDYRRTGYITINMLHFIYKLTQNWLYLKAKTKTIKIPDWNLLWPWVT
jgi:hypothetical protein